MGVFVESLEIVGVKRDVPAREEVQEEDEGGGAAADEVEREMRGVSCGVEEGKYSCHIETGACWEGGVDPGSENEVDLEKTTVEIQLRLPYWACLFVLKYIESNT